jgi:cyclomaltodextrinase
MPETPAWVRDAVFYEIFPDRFAASDRVTKPGPLEAWASPPTNHGFKGGDLLGIAEHLDHIAELGATALYLTPVFQSASNHRYHTYDYLKVDPLLGGDAALRELLDRAHDRGIRVILDGVFNHTGRGFWPFNHVLETGAGSPYRHWFNVDQEALDQGRSLDAYPSGRHRWDPDTSTEPARSRYGYDAWWGIPDLPKLNVAEPAVREYLWQVGEHWLRFGIDGWRLDVPAEINDPPFWAEFRRRCRAVNPEVYLVGEIWHPAAEWVAGDPFDGLMNYPLAKAILGFVGGGSLNDGLLQLHNEYRQVVRLDGPAFAGRLTELLSMYGPASNAAQLNVLGSHDTPRIHSLLEGDREALELAGLLQATFPGAPCIYYGDEIGLAGGMDPDSRRAFPWDRAAWDEEILGSTRAALALRHAEPALRGDDLTVLTAQYGSLVIERRTADSRLAVALNAGDHTANLAIPGAEPGATILLAAGRARSTAPELTVRDGSLAIDLAPRSGVVIRLA